MEFGVEVVGNDRVIHARPQSLLLPHPPPTLSFPQRPHQIVCIPQTTKMSKPSTSSNPLPALSSLADPPQKYIDACAMDYFLIEAVHTLRASSLVASTRAKKIEKEMIDAGLIPPPAAPGATAKDLNRVRGSAGASRESLGSAGPTSGSTITNAGKGDEEEEGLRVRLEAIGIHVGSNFAERFVPSS